MPFLPRIPTRSAQVIGVIAMMMTSPAAAATGGDKANSAYPEMSREQTLPLIAKALRDHLLDAGSVTNFTVCDPPVKVKYKNGRPVRWTVMFSLNAKNSYGGYAGAQQMAAVFHADKPVRIVSTGMAPMTFGECKRVPNEEIRQLIEAE